MMKLKAIIMKALLQQGFKPQSLVRHLYHEQRCTLLATRDLLEQCSKTPSFLPHTRTLDFASLAAERTLLGISKEHAM
jgi:hypothetical protein